jgi:hypothetical protein
MTEIKVDDSVAAAYENVRSDSSDVNWVIFGYADDINGG